MAKRGTQQASDSDDSAFLFGAGGGQGGGGSTSGGGGEDRVPLHDAAQSRYLNYALSVITSRALPDVRDGLKPVQRRILFTMWQAGLRFETKHRKCAKVVGDVMGNYHPHGDMAIYDALVRMAQSFSLRVPTIDGSGNFGSLDGDPAAAMRYTECRLAGISSEILSEIGQGTVPFRPNYDGTRTEPVVLPSRLPNLLINGATGIAVGMATNIPPHNPAEVCRALLKMLEAPDLEIQDDRLVTQDAIQGPDFPTGGQILSSREELREIYRTGTGTVRVRSNWRPGAAVGRASKTIVIDSVPYTVSKAQLIERIAEVVVSRKMPLLLDVRDLSADDVHIELEIKKDADEQKVMAYLYKHTPLQTNFSVNLTCLIPTENPEVGAPARLGLKEILRHFLHFRLQVVTRRLEHELAQLEKRIHILDGFALIFDALDEIIRIIRKSEGKADAAEKIMARFTQLDAEQTDAILELKLYRLARLEINLVKEELDAKRARAQEIRGLLAESTDDSTASGRWGLVREEIKGLLGHFTGDAKQLGRRRTLIEAGTDEPSFSEEDFIVAEEAHVLITADGWVKRQKEIPDPQKTRLREGDRVLACIAGSTRETVAFFSSLGTCYTARIIDLPATAGYGEPIQKLFKLKDGEKIVAAVSMDPRALGIKDLAVLADDPAHPDTCPELHALTATSDGYALRFSLAPFAEPSTRAGRKFARPATGQTVVGLAVVYGTETILAATIQCRAMVCAAVEVNYLAGPGKGVQLIKLSADDYLLGFKASRGDRDLLTVETNRGATKTVSTVKYKVTARGGRGWEIQKNGRLSRIVFEEVAAAPSLEEGR